MSPDYSSISVYPTWDAHHYFIERRAQITDRLWAQIVGQPDWTDHARGDLRAERICDNCLAMTARGHTTVSDAAAKAEVIAEARAELTRRGVAWMT